MTSASTAVSAAIPLAIVAEPIHDRAWWTEESARVGTGWPAVIDAALEMMKIEPKRLARLRRLMADDVSLERAWHVLRDKHSNFQKGDFR
jgi:hypothetical protein